TASGRPRVFGYVRASTSKQIASPETQRQIIEEYCRRIDCSLDAVYADPATSGKKPLFERSAGQELATTLRKGDHVVVARLDRLSRSFVGFALVLQAWEKLGVTLHLCDMPGGGVMDPDNPMARLMIHILIAFAEYERKLISVRTKEGLHAIRERGGKYCRWAEYGWRWEKRHDSRQGCDVNVKVPD